MSIKNGYLKNSIIILSKLDRDVENTFCYNI